MSASLFMERVWTSNSIPKKKIFMIVGPDIFTKEVCCKVLTDRMLKTPRMATANGREFDRFGFQLARLSTFEGADGVVARLHNSTIAEPTPALRDWSRKSTIIFVDVGETVPSGKPLYEWIKTDGLVINCERYPEYSDDMKAMVMGMFKAFDKVPTDDVVREIVGRAGNDIMVVSNLVNLICLSGLPLTAQSIQAASEYDRRDDVFELVTALAMKKFDKVFLILKALMDRDESPRQILERLAYIFSNIWSVLKMTKSERVPWQIQGVMSVNGHEARQLAHLQKLYDARTAYNIYNLIMEAFDSVLNKGYYPALALTILLVDVVDSSDGTGRPKY